MVSEETHIQKSDGTYLEQTKADGHVCPTVGVRWEVILDELIHITTESYCV